jgi:aldose 1-epimerase
MKKELFGKTETGAEVYCYTLENSEAVLEILTYGATIRSFRPYGVSIVCGFDNFDYYLGDRSPHGAVVGRVANRIEGAELTIDGAIYMLSANQMGNCLHGGFENFSRKVWEVKEFCDDHITLSYYSPDGEEGFPGGLLTELTYTLKGATLILEYSATPDAKTAVALTNHSFFNLDGIGGTVYETKARIYAKTYTAVDERLLPNGEHPSVVGTVYDFSYPKAFGADFPEGFRGHDVNYNLCPESFKEFLGKSVGLCAEVWGKKLKMSVYTDQPGVQFYIGNFLGSDPDPAFRGDIKKIRHGAFCLETQTEPNCVNHGEGFYEAGETYFHNTVYKIEQK